jgi:alpha-ketoglutarate-dependent taurine dioxygenase
MFNPFSLDHPETYLAWRTQKLAAYPTTTKDLVVSIANPYQLTSQEKGQILSLCQKTNLAVYQIDSDQPADKPALQALAAQFGLHHLDHNLGADDDGITAIQVVAEPHSQEYIPYTNRPINWHTDGYYNPPHQQIRALLLHCTRPALTGGENLLLDHEIAYLHLRDENPDYIAALLVNDVMTIPPNIEAGVEIRTAQPGPVFSIEPQRGTLHMRYTARTRSIIWKPNTTTAAALKFLTNLLNSDTPYIFRHRLAPNQGLLCNNVLHTRSGFSDGPTLEQQRLLYRLRFYDRIANT